MKGIMTWGYECWGCSCGDLLVPKRVRQNNSILHPFESLASLKLIFEHLKMDGWKTIAFPFGAILAYFQG